MKPSTSIGRNYRLELEKRLRKINQSREKTSSLKIMDEHGHLMKTPVLSIKKKCGSTNKPSAKVDKNKSSAGVVPLMVCIEIH